MPRSRSARRNSTYSSAQTELTEEEVNVEAPKSKVIRAASVYDAVAGRIGLNGFLTIEQLQSANVMPSLPEQVLLRRVGAPDEIPFDFYNADERLGSDQKLPDSDLLKAIHNYASEFFAAVDVERGDKDFRSFDESALLALGILLEEASKEALGENGDMALVEPEGLELGLAESRKTEYQIIGKVKPRQLQPKDSQSDESDELIEESPRKKRRSRV